MLDCLIVGGGPAGLTGPTIPTSRRYRRAACCLSMRGPAGLRSFQRTHNYPGFKGIGGPELLTRLRDQAVQYGASLKTGRVVSLSRRPDGAFTATCDGRELAARSVLLATGLIDESPKIPGLEAGVYNGTIRYCPICDAYEATDPRIGVIGNLTDAGKKALFLRTYSRDVVLFTTHDTPNSVMRGRRSRRPGLSSRASPASSNASMTKLP